MRRSCALALLGLVGVLLWTLGPASGSPYFLIDSETEWNGAMSLSRIKPMEPMQWQDYMIQWINYLQEGDPYPSNTFLRPELYVWPGGGGGGLDPEDAGLVMVWRPTSPGSYSSAWKYEYGLDPDLTGCTINVTVTAPQFGPLGNQVNNVSFGIRDAAGNIRSWHWNCGPGAPIPWNTPTQITINPMILSVNAATPAASGFANNPMFIIAQSMSFIVDENAQWVAQQGVPPPGQQIPAVWNYWHNLYVTPPIPPKFPDPIKWSQPVVEVQPGLQPPLFNGWDQRSLYQQPPIAADDWECTDERPVTDIHWWGSFINWTQPEPPMLPRAFHLAIWTDVPKNPPDVPFSHPGIMVWEHYCDTYTWNFAGYDKDPRGIYQNEACFQFHQYIPQDKWFYQEPGPNGRNVYWLSIAAIYDTPEIQYPWGWKTRPHFWNDDAVRIQQVVDPTGISGWPPHVGWQWAQGQPIMWQDESWDLAFELTTIEMEQPRHDLGDAPDSSNNVGVPMTAYPGVPANFPTAFQGGAVPAGPLHKQPLAMAFLGNGVSLENEADTGPDQDPTNNIQPAANAPNLDLADDGVVVPLALPNCQWTSFNYTVTCPAATTVPLYVNVWFDWNRDGDWDDTMQCPAGGVAPEWAVQNQVIPAGTPAGTQTFTTPQFLPWNPATAQPAIWMRITIAEQPWQPAGLLGWGGCGPSTGYEYGETEDYVFDPVNPQPGNLTFAQHSAIPDHFWWPQPGNNRNNMLCMDVSADAIENIQWNTVQLTHVGTGNTADVVLIEVWQDVDGDCKWSSADLLLGSGTYVAGVANIALSAPPVIPAGSTLQVVVTYRMSNLIVSPIGSTFRFSVTAASGIGQTSGLPVGILGLPVTSATKIIGLRPISIGVAKQLPIGTQFLLDGKVCTANFQTNMSLFYIEELDRSAGIGVDMSGAGVPAPVSMWDRVSVLGTCSLINGTELVVTPQQIAVAPGVPPWLGTRFAVGMNNKWTGGGVFGGQPGTFDDAWANTPSYGLNNVGMLLNTWGEVTYHQTNFALLPLMPTIPTGDMFWINDGSNLLDGTTNMVGGRNVGVACWLPRGYPGLPNPGEYWGVTGILRTFPSPMGFPFTEPVRLLVPRMPADLVRYR